jgi:hypothetical protein
MNEKLNELKDYPKWIEHLTKEQQYEWYLRIKNSLPQWRLLRNDISDLERAIKDYETRNNIISK